MGFMARAYKSTETDIKTNLFGEQESFFLELANDMALKPFQGKEIYRWIYKRRMLDPENWTSLPAGFREKLKTRFGLYLPEIRTVLKSEDGTKKFLLSLNDALEIESVYIPQKGRATLCLSTQVGCPVGCGFCLTGKMGFKRNLSPSEILGQLFLLEKECGLIENSYNVVFMGMGEPLLNFENLRSALNIMTDPDGMGISRKRITVSTIGIRSGLEAYLEDPALPPLAISLHSASEETRKELIPAGKDFSLKEIRKLLQHASRKEREPISLEYIIIDGINSGIEDAYELAKFCSGLKVKVNIIPFNPNPYVHFKKPDAKKVIEFQDILDSKGILSTIRQSRGSDISAACGQLAVFERNTTP
jgi:23S rRNA (adenine2503-C2)-methyltransferase